MGRPGDTLYKPTIVPEERGLEAGIDPSSIKCESDVGMFAARWVKEEDKDINFIPSFNSMHMCRNFDDVLEWVSSHQRDKTRTPEIRDDDVVLTDPRDAYI
ncbi:hypothetical protein PRZ48_002246 [Zasmidium cellare]|uniref:Uncharacterized protein n=1 Tax=Zasmidium cellare TaxID=395010 RepID=A0ABR0F481_ZASCE|nr:hypothetical protein PRZ48_002246 [Zasmidium cellare]